MALARYLDSSPRRVEQVLFEDVQFPCLVLVVSPISRAEVKADAVREDVKEFLKR
jgi:hypothetical protein